MKKENGCYIDENNNKWNINYYTKEEAEKYSKSLVNCSDCSDCKNCSDCSDCKNCSYCSYCRNCSYCSDCSDCKNCSYCSYCIDCINCRNCSYCSDCIDCSDCSYFKDNPNRVIINNIGSRYDTFYCYWLCDTIQVKTGCFNGNLLQFEKAVVNNHGKNKYGTRYMDLINKIWLLMEV